MTAAESLANPIISSPYDAPEHHFEIGPNGPTGELLPGRRPSESFIPVPVSKKGRKEQEQLDFDATGERRDKNTLINDIRREVERWRASNWNGVTPYTRKLLTHWAPGPHRDDPVLFCQREAAETAIFLAEVAGRHGTADYRRRLEPENVLHNDGLPRIGLKMATGTGKTVVMGMLIAWQTINKVMTPKDARFAKRFLIVTPGITIRDRLGVLHPERDENYYRGRDLVPTDLWEALLQAQVEIVNYHTFLPRDSKEIQGVASNTRKLLRGGKPDVADAFRETPDMVAARILRTFGAGKGEIVVLNDEAHHCYQDKLLQHPDDEADKEDKDRNRDARVWFRGLHDLRRKAGIKTVYDLSATPYYLKGSGYNEGFIFPWVVSDFSLMDAIESGIVKIPRIPVDDDAAGRQLVYLHLWDNIQPPLPKRRAAKDTDHGPQGWPIPETLEGALRSLYRSYEGNHSGYEATLAALGEPPPVLIVVCPNTVVSKLVFDWIAGREVDLADGSTRLAAGNLPLLSNVEDGIWTTRQRTILVDSAQLESGEPLGTEFRKDAAREIEAFKQAYRLRNPGADVDKLADSDLLREAMNTIGKKGKLGEHIRCVVSVAMLTEGWDANTVTHILGIRPFRSQLLCEQVVGRGLRRRSYAVNEDSGHFEPEYAEIYGVPFAFIPGGPPPPKPKDPRPAIEVRSLDARWPLAIRFPKLDGYRVELPDEPLHADFDNDSKLHVDQTMVALWVENQGVVGESEQVDLDDIRNARAQRIAFSIAKTLVQREEFFAAHAGGERPWLFPQLVEICQRWLDACVTTDAGVTKGHLLLTQAGARAAEKVFGSIVRYPDNRPTILLPIIRRFDSIGSTDDVRFLTRKVVMDPPPTKSHLNHVVLDGVRGNSWEEGLAYLLEHLVSALARAESDAAGGWAGGCSPDSLASLWGVLEHLVSTQGRSTAESRDALLDLKIFPLIDGTFSDAVTARAAIPGTTKLLGDARVDAPLLDSRRLRESPKLVGLVEEVSPADMVVWVHRAFDSGSIPSDRDRGRLLDWFTNRDDAVLASIPDRLRSLPIFPTGTGYQSLGALALPVEGFKDPLDLADVLHLEGRPAATRAFLEGLGARELTLDHYCTEFVARAVQLGINDAQMRALLRFLATELSRVQDDADVRDALADLELVTCTDRKRRRGAEVYFAGIDLLLVGADRPIAAPPASPAVRRLYEWLGVSSTARPADVIQHGRTLRSAPSNLRETATAVLRHLADQDETAWERDFTLLQGLLWLPVQNDRTRAASPSSVHTIFQQNLFRSQADFLDIGQRDQVQCRVVLTWLGVETEPTVEQAVGHLLYCRDADTPVKDDMWDFLARHVEDPVLDRLRGEPCVLLGNGSYVIAAHCFWSENPFGRHRHHLGDRFRKWSDLFERLGVRERPDAADAVDVLQSIAAAHGGADEPLLAADVEVVDSCWVFLDRLVRDDGLGSEDVADLASTECVLAADRTLQRPCDVLFRDSSAISAEFDEEARRFLISRPENASHALEAAGVRHLRAALTTSVVERIDAEGRSLLEERFEDRRLLVLRVLAAGDGAASTKVAQFTQSVDIVALHQLTVVERIEVAGRPFESRPFDRAALFRAAASEMLVAEGEPGDRRWDEIATEVAFALGINPDDVPSSAMSLKVVLEADTPEAVVRVLDAMRFPPLDKAIHIDLSDEVMDTFADEESVDGASDQDSQEPGDDVAERESPEPHDEPVERDGPTPAPPTGEEATGKAEESKGGGSGGSAEPSTDGKAKEEGAPPGAHPNGGLKSGQQGKKRESYKQRERDQLRSYLQSEGETASTRERDGLSDEQRRKVDAAAVDAVVAYEERVGRAPERMPHENEGFDVRSTAADGSVRYIEVKGTSPQWDRQGVALSSRQFQEARTRGDEFWLYVVEVGKPGADPIRIQDPANRVRQYFLDSGWRIADEERERIVRTLPELVIHAEPPGDGAVRLIDWCDGVTQLGWIEVDIEQPPPDAYALQIAGDALGLALRGGAVVTSPGEPEEHDWVVVRLADQLDPDTGAPVCIRQWVPERDFAGMLLGVRLQSDGSIPPITIEDPSTVQILGIVSHQLRVDDLSTVVSADG